MAVGSASSGPGSSHPVKIFANIFIAFIGAGVLGLPYAFKEAGILEGIITMAFVSVVSAKAMLLIIDCKYKILGKQVKGIPSGMTVDVDMGDHEGLVPLETNIKDEDFSQQEQNLMIRVKEPKAGPTKDLSYGDVGFYALGHTGRVLVDIAIVISQTGFCCAYIIFISENLSDYITGVKIGEWLLLLLPPLFLLTLLRHLSSLALSSLLAQVSNLMAFGVVFWFDFEHLFKITIHPKEMSIRGFPFFFAIAIYCYEGAGMILALESSLAEEIRHKFKKFFISAMFVVTTLYVSFGTCGYLSFGPETKSIITLNLPKGVGFDFGMLVKSCLCLGIFFTYPVMMFPVIKIMETYFLPDAGKSVWKANMLRFFLVVLTGFVVLAVPNFANLMALVGASCCTLLAFILPGIFHMNVFRGSLSRSQKMLDWLLIFIGVCGTIVGTWDALKRLSDAPETGSVSSEGFTTVESVTAAAAAHLDNIVPPAATSRDSVADMVRGNQSMSSVIPLTQNESLHSSLSLPQNDSLTSLVNKVIQKVASSGTGKAAEQVSGNQVVPSAVLHNGTSSSIP